MSTIAEIQEEMKLDILILMITNKITCLDLLDNLMDLKIVLEKNRKNKF